MAIKFSSFAMAAKAASEWWKRLSSSRGPMTGFNYHLVVVPGANEDSFRLNNPNAVPAFNLYRDLVIDPNWRSAAEELLAKTRRMANANPTSCIYVTDIVPTHD
jgi:hypothetical protein